MDVLQLAYQHKSAKRVMLEHYQVLAYLLMGEFSNGLQLPVVIDLAAPALALELGNLFDSTKLPNVISGGALL